MDPSATPWRVLEDPADEKAESRGREPSRKTAGRSACHGPRSSPGRSRSSWRSVRSCWHSGRGRVAASPSKAASRSTSGSPGASSGSDSRGAAGSGQRRRRRDRRGGRATRRLPAAGGFARRRPRGGGRRVRAARRCGPCRAGAQPRSRRSRTVTRSGSRHATMPSLPPARPAGGEWPGSRAAARRRRAPIDLNRATEARARHPARDRSGHRGEDRRVARGTAVHRGRGPADPQARRREDVRVAQGPRHGLADDGPQQPAWRSVRSSPRWRPVRSHRTTSGRRSRWRSPPSCWSARHVRVSVWPRRAAGRGRSGGRSRSASRLVPAGPPQLDHPPDGDGPWRLVVESVGSPRDGKQTATLATTGDGPAFRVAATLPRYPVVIPGDEIVGRRVDPRAPGFAVWRCTSSGSGRSAR